MTQISTQSACRQIPHIIWVSFQRRRRRRSMRGCVPAQIHVNHTVSGVLGFKRYSLMNNRLNFLIEVNFGMKLPL